MKRLSIKLRVTLWFTLMMVLLVAAVLTFLIAAGEHIELLGARDTLTRTVAESFDELEWDEGELDAEDFDDYSRGVHLAVYSADGDRIYGRLPNGFDDSLALSAAGIAAKQASMRIGSSMMNSGAYPDICRSGCAGSCPPQRAAHLRR